MVTLQASGQDLGLKRGLILLIYLDHWRLVVGPWVRYAAYRANVPTGVHILRHTFCSHLVMRGAAMRSVQELVGHQDLTMTQRYSHLSPAALIDTVRLLESRVAESWTWRNTGDGRRRG